MLDPVEPEGPISAPSHPTPRKRWRLFLRSWRWTVPTGILLASVAAYATLQTYEPLYQGTSLLEANNGVLYPPGVDPTIPDLAKSEKTVLFDPIVFDPVLADPNMRNAPSLSDPHTAKENLSNNLSVAEAGSGFRMKVCYQDTDREAAAMVCNAIVESYLRQRDGFDHARTRNLERWLEPELQRWENEVEVRQVKVAELNEHLHGKSASAVERELTMNSVMQLGSKLSELETRLAVLDAQLSLDESPDDSPSGDLESLPDAPRVQTDQSRKRERELLAVEVEVVKTRFEEQRSKLKRMRGNSTELEFARAELNVASSVLNKLRTREATIRTETRRGGAVRLLAPATAPQDPVNSPPVKRAALFSSIAFFSPLMLGFLLGFRRDVVTQPR